MRVIVTRKSREYTRTKRGRPYNVKYVTAQIEGQNNGVMFPIYPRAGIYPPAYIYRILEIPDRKRSPANLDNRWHRNAEGGPLDSICWLNGFNQSEIKDTGEYYTKHLEVDVPLKGARFFRHHVEIGDISLSASELGFEHLPVSLNGVDLKGSVTIAGKFQKRIRPVYDKETRRREWKVKFLFVEGEIDKNGSDLEKLVELITAGLQDQRREEVLDKIREALRQGKYVTMEEFTASDLFDDPQEILQALAMKKEYEPVFFNMLKQESRDEIYYSDNGFLFQINKTIVWETPTYGTATYVFDRTLSPEKLGIALGEITRSQLLASKALQLTLGFLRRAIHPGDSGSESSLNRWLQDVLV